MKVTYQELVDLLRHCHKALEIQTDLTGCDFPTAVILTDCENALNEIDGGRQACTLIESAGLSIH